MKYDLSVFPPAPRLEVLNRLRLLLDGPAQRTQLLD